MYDRQIIHNKYTEEGEEDDEEKALTNQMYINLSINGINAHFMTIALDIVTICDEKIVGDPTNGRKYLSKISSV